MSQKIRIQTFPPIFLTNLILLFVFGGLFYQRKNLWLKRLWNTNTSLISIFFRIFFICCRFICLTTSSSPNHSQQDSKQQHCEWTYGLMKANMVTGLCFMYVLKKCKQKKLFESARIELKSRWKGGKLSEVNICRIN